MKRRVVVVDGQGTLVGLTRPLLERAGFGVEEAGSVEEALDGPAARSSLVVLDACAPSPGGPPRMIAELRRHVYIPILQVSGCHSVDAACRWHPVRADAFLVRPFSPGDFVEAVEDLARDPEAAQPDFHGMHGSAERMREVFAAVRLVAPTDSTVVLSGETGTGKEMLAWAVHAESSVSDGPFVPVDCGALSESLLESELFGHVKGAFTGAQGKKSGLIEAATGGTLFLDEVGNMPPRLQMLLLRALQERRIRRVGGTELIDVDVRLVAATGRDLAAEVQAGRFREDLYYRLRVFVIEVPPLRERHGDVERIVARHLGGAQGNEDRLSDRISPAAVEILRRYDWPGNVRELLGVLEGARIRSGGGPIGVEHLPAAVVATVRGSSGDPAQRGVPDDGHARASETERILRALRKTGGNRTRAAELLGMSRTTLWRRMRDLDVEPPG